MGKQTLLLAFLISLLWSCGTNQAPESEPVDPVLKETIIKEEAAAEAIDSLTEDIHGTSEELQGLLEDLN